MALHSLNIARIVTLFYLGQFNRAWFDFSTSTSRESLIFIDTLAIFWGWALPVRRRVLPNR